MMYRYRAKLVRCVDGDTADIEVDLGFYMTAKIRGRLTGVDTPERGKPDYKKDATKNKQNQAGWVPKTELCAYNKAGCL